MHNQFELDGYNLNLNTVAIYAKEEGQVTQFSFSQEAKARVKKARDFVLECVKKGEPVYGINTGFGALSSVNIAAKDTAELQVNLIRSHCTGVGKPLNREIVRAMILIQTQSLLKGHSGVQEDIIQRLIDFLNHDIVPVVPEKGSVGASGDLAPLAHIAYCLMGEGQVVYQGKTMQASQAVQQLDLKPVVLGPKDGIGLINGTHLMAAQAVIAVDHAQYLMDIADFILAMSLDALQGSIRAFDEDLHALKAHPGQVETAQRVRQYLKGSDILKNHENCTRVQDPYSLRCAAQVYGACKQTLRHAKEVLNTELQAVTDNPIVFADKGESISGGHFHGQALAFIMDYLAMGLAEVCNIAERRVVKLLNPTFSQLPAFLAKGSGLHNGLMIAQYTMASLVAENRIFCHPASVDSVSTSNDKEDHVSMGPNAGRKLMQVIDNVYHCLAIEALCAAEAIELLRPLKSSNRIETAVKVIREQCPQVNEDRFLSKDINAIESIIRQKNLYV
ncbi:MAG TPA: histidine ammonia-lyase [Oligoflexia bacterium]|nr:histidine ammonia-lyase [Oligoflexia bacterium]HMR24904.1 histidine ammonia-lyase [Oligoflexia bacterium]